jgi:signal transduction histidine kinase
MTRSSSVPVFVLGLVCGAFSSAFVRRGRSAGRRLPPASNVVEEPSPKRALELAELSHHLIRVSEQEKAQLARELHDALGSNLTAINMDVAWVQKRLRDTEPQLAERLQRALGVIAQTVEIGRAVIEGLRPMTLDHLGLDHAMRAHCEEFSKRTGVPCDTAIDANLGQLDPAWSIALYRIAQEALTNITKHASATRAKITLERTDGSAGLRIVDDGVGIKPDVLTKPQGYGIMGMRERVRQLGGTLTIERGLNGRGTIIYAHIPMKRRAPVA